MTEEEIAKAINPEIQNVYAPTHAPTTLFYKDGTIKAGYFQHTPYSDEMKKKNIFTFIEFGVNAQGYKATGDKKYITEVKGENLERVFYPQLLTLKYNRVFTVNINNTITPKLPVRIGGITTGPGVSFGNGVFIGGINLFEYTDKNLEGYVDNGMFVINRIL
ncbi:MAG: hypothetical protein ACOYOR_05010 [Flavobacterium psychrophilum]